MEGFLQTIEQFISLNEDEKELFQKIVTVQSLTKNSFFIREGQICNRVAFVESGILRHFYYTEDKIEVTRWVSLKNTFSTSFASFIRDTPSHENIQAIQDSIILTISKKDWQTLCDQYPTFHEIWVKNIESLYIGMEERVFSLIALQAEQRYEFLCNTYPEFIKEVPLKFIASMLGMEPRHLSRIRNRKQK
jgi:CRP-like cAMP-binding protein